ncbi:hypothetical protein TNCV_4577101 [Trichonephila clavipes]|nr:hypothetical protein TNCV_4577101 [Trichonephila clavipes]
MSEWLVHRASTPQVRGSNPGLGKVDSAFHPYSGSIFEYQAFVGTEGFTSDVPPDRDICSCTSGSKVTYTELGTVGRGPYGLLCH